MHGHVRRALLVGAMLQTFAATASAQEGMRELDCLIQPYRVVEVATPVVGVVDTISVERGDLVRQNGLIARLRAEVERADVELARARLEFQKRKLARSEELFKKKIVSSHERDLAETEAKIAQMELERAQELLQMRVVRSPITGVVVERFLAPGELAQQAKIVKIAQIDPLNIEVIAPVEMFGRIGAGMRARVVPEQPLGSVYEAKVTVVDRVVDAASGTFGVRLELPNRDYRVPAGIKCKLSFVGGRDHASGRK